MSNDPQTEENTASAAPVDGSTEEIREADVVSEPAADVASSIDKHDSAVDTENVEADTEKAADAVEAAPGASGVQALPYPAPENSGSDAATTKPVKKFWGMPRYVGLAVMSACVVVVLVIAALLVTNVVKQRAEEREAAVSKYETALVEYDSTNDALEKQLEEADKMLAALKESDLEKPEHLKRFSDKINLAKKAKENAQTGAIDIEESDNSALVREADALNDSEISLSAASNSVTDAVLALEQSFNAKAAADEAAAKAKAKAAAGTISFVDLSRGGESLKGNYYVFEGKVIQDSGSGSFRVSITAEPGYSRTFWNDPIMLVIVGEPSQRIIEEDIIKFTAKSGGLFSYESVMGATITVPLVTAEGVDVSVTGHDN